MKYEKSLYVPNALYVGHVDPNINRFKAVGTGLETYTMMIFDNYGNVIWETSKINDKGEPVEYWHGDYKNNHALQDVYIWRVYGKYKDETVWGGKENIFGDKLIKKDFYMTGTVTLIR